MRQDGPEGSGRPELEADIRDFGLGSTRRPARSLEQQLIALVTNRAGELRLQLPFTCVLHEIARERDRGRVLEHGEYPRSEQAPARRRPDRSVRHAETTQDFLAVIAEVLEILVSDDCDVPTDRHPESIDREVALAPGPSELSSAWILALARTLSSSST